MFTCGLSDLLSCGRFVGCFVLWEYSSGLNINIARSEILVWCLVYIDQLLFFKQIVDIFFSKAYCQELYILITEYCNVVTLAEW